MATKATATGGTTYTATTIKNVNIQDAYSFGAGKITAVNGSHITLTVLADKRNRRRWCRSRQSR